MVKITMFNKIKECQRKGYGIKATSKKLSLARKTVRKYFKMSERKYKKYFYYLSNRVKCFDEYKDDILSIYSANNNKKLNIVSIYDFLEEKHKKLPGTERTLRNFIDYLIITNQLSLNNNTRIYSKVPEHPYGYQMQLDFGEYTTKSGLKLYIFAAVLSASRFKYIAYQDKPFITLDVILHLLDCFDYFRGIPQQLVIDQDKLMVVSENKGDIIYTKYFQYFLEETKIKMYVCRKADPESKGRIENVVKFVKYNHLQTRDFKDITQADQSVKDWLSRRGNGKICQANNQIPAEIISAEREKLRPLINSIFRKDTLIAREPRDASDKSLISVEASQYSVPKRYKNRTVEVYIITNKVFVFDIYSGKQIAEHDLSLIPGAKIINRVHFRETEKSSKELKNIVLNMYSLKNWDNFVSENFKMFPRYIRDQCIEAKKHFLDKQIRTDILDKALIYCLNNKTFSFANLRDTYKHYTNKDQTAEYCNEIKQIKSNNSHKKIEVTKRSLDFYNSYINYNMEVLK